MLAPAASYRDLIVPGPRESAKATATPADCASAHGPDAQRRENTRRSTWAELLLRVFAIDVLECPHCGGRRNLIVLITDEVVVRKVLDPLGIDSEPPDFARARGGEGLALDA